MKLKSLLPILLILTATLIASASEHGGGEGEKKEKPKAPTESYDQVEAKVRESQSRVLEYQKSLKELAEKRNAAKSEAEVREILDEMIQVARKMKETYIKYQKDKKRMLYEFPGKGSHAEHQYKRFELEMTEEFNSWSNIDIRLKGVLGKVESAYEKPAEVVEMEQKKKQSKESPHIKAERKSVKDEVKKEGSDRPVLSK